jgi:hypothetical protein
MPNLVNGKEDIASMIPTVWSSKLYARLRANLVFMNIFSREYEGEIKEVGDTVKVNEMAAITGEDLTDDKQEFTAQALSFTPYQIVANRRAVAAVEVTDMAKLQSLEFQEKLMDELTYTIMLKIENYLISLISPSASAPDHIIAPASASDLAPVDLSSLRTLASRAFWPLSERYFVPSPEYYSDLSNKSQIMSHDFTKSNDSDSGTVNVYSGFRILESQLLAVDTGIACHPSAVQAVMQTAVNVKVSDQHVNGKFSHLISADIIYGATQFDNKRLAKISG